MWWCWEGKTWGTLGTSSTKVLVITNQASNHEACNHSHKPWASLLDHSTKELKLSVSFKINVYSDISRPLEEESLMIISLRWVVAWSRKASPAHLQGQLQPSHHHEGLWREELCGRLWPVSGIKIYDDKRDHHCLSLKTSFIKFSEIETFSRIDRIVELFVRKVHWGQVRFPNHYLSSQLANLTNWGLKIIWDNLLAPLSEQCSIWSSGLW